MLYLPTIFFLIFIFPASLFSQWTDPGLYGGKITDIAIQSSSPNVLFASNQYGCGLYKSNDSGNSWSEIDSFSGIPLNAVLIDRTYPGYIYAGGNDGFYKSTDSGITWSKRDIGSGEAGSSYIRTIAMSDSGVIYTGCGIEGAGGWIYRSANRGNSWTQIFRSSSQYEIVNKIEIDSSNSNILWAACGSRILKIGGRIYRTTNGGISWNELSEGEITSGFLDSIAIKNISVAFVGGETGIYKTGDGGSSWVSVISTQSAVTALMIDPDNTNIVYAGCLGKIYKSTDTGATFQSADISGITGISCFAMAPSTGSIIYAGDCGNGVIRTLDSGTNWSKINTGISGMSVHKILSKDRIYLATVGGLYSLTNGIFSPIDTTNGRCTTITSECDFIYAGYENGKIYKYLLTDEGYSANLVNKIDEIIWDMNISSLTIYIASGKYDGSDGHLYKSSDGGFTLTDVLGTLGTPANCIAVSSATIFLGTGDFFSGKTLGGIWKYKTTWEKVVSGEIVKKIAISGNKIFACFGGNGSGSNKGLYKSDDQGTTFQKSGNFPVSTDYFSAILIDGSNIYTTDSENFYKSSDSGFSWTYINTDGTVYDIAIAEDGNLYCATSKGLSVFSGFPYMWQEKSAVIYNYPNPFNLTQTSQTTIKYSITDSADIKVALYSLTGGSVKEWNEGVKTGKQSYFISWDGRDNNGDFVPSGLYIVVLKTDKKIASNKIAVIR